MATVYTNVATKQNAPSFASSNINEAIVLTPKTRIATATYTVTAALAANDVINIVKLPKHSVVIPHLSQVDSDGVGATTATIKIGDNDVTAAGVDASDDDRYGAALDVNAAGKDAFDSSTRGVASNTPYALQSDSWIQATVATLTGTATADRVLTFRIAYNTL